MKDLTIVQRYRMLVWVVWPIAERLAKKGMIPSQREDRARKAGGDKKTA